MFTKTKKFSIEEHVLVDLCISIDLIISFSSFDVIKVCPTSSADLYVFVLSLRSARLCRQTFMFLFCLLCIIIKVCPTLSADLYVFVLSFVYY